MPNKKQPIITSEQVAAFNRELEEQRKQRMQMIKLGNYTMDELLALPTEELAPLIFGGNPVIFMAESTPIPVEFHRESNIIKVDASHHNNECGAWDLVMLEFVSELTHRLGTKFALQTRPTEPTTIERVRLRPGLFVVDIDLRGLHHLFFSVLDNAITESLAAGSTEVHVRMDEDTITVRDFGNGMPVDIAPGDTVPMIERLLTDYAVEWDWMKQHKPARRGHNSIGLMPVNALSSAFTVENYRDGMHYRLSFEQGVPQGMLVAVGLTDQQGTSVTFTPDTQIFGDKYQLRASVIRAFLEQMAFLHSNMTFRFEHAMTGDRITYAYPGGIAEYLELLTFESYPCFPVWEGHLTQDDMSVAVAMQYCPQESTILTYVNNERIFGGGAQERGLLSGLARVMSDYARREKLFKEPWPGISPKEVRHGMIAIINLHLPNPQFQASNRTTLCGDDLERLMETLATEVLAKHIRSMEASDREYLLRGIGRQHQRR